MVFLMILLLIATGGLLCLLFQQHKHLNILEQIVLGSSAALSLFVLELFLQGVIFDQLSLVGPVATFVLLLGLVIYKSTKNPTLLADYTSSLKTFFKEIRTQFSALAVWKKVLTIGFLVYALIKVVMVFGINVNMPTFDEDALTGRDLKTKVFVENKSLMLDQQSPEFLGSALERNIFAPLTDTYFLLASDTDRVQYTNIVSPLFYLFSILLFAGIFFRKSNLFFAAIGTYIFSSLPFVFVHGFGAYWNFISGLLLFMWIFYFLDQYLLAEKTNNKIIYLLSLLTFVTITVRNESFILVTALLVCSLVLYRIINRKITMNGDNKKAGAFLIGSILVSYLANKYVVSLYPKGSALWIGSNDSLVKTFFQNITNGDMLVAPLQHAFYHSDYNILFTLLVLSLIVIFTAKGKEKESLYMAISFLILFGGTVFMLFGNPNLGVISHLSFIRFGIVFVPFMVYIVVMALRAWNKKLNNLA